MTTKLILFAALVLSIECRAGLPPDGKSGINEDQNTIDWARREENALKTDLQWVKYECQFGNTKKCQDAREKCKKNHEHFVDQLMNNPDTWVSTRKALAADIMRGQLQRAKERSPECSE